MKSKSTNQDVSLCIFQSIIFASTFYSPCALLGHVSTVASVLLGETEEGLNGLLIYGVVSGISKRIAWRHVQSECP